MPPELTLRSPFTGRPLRGTPVVPACRSRSLRKRTSISEDKTGESLTAPGDDEDNDGAEMNRCRSTVNRRRRDDLDCDETRGPHDREPLLTPTWSSAIER